MKKLLVFPSKKTSRHFEKNIKAKEFEILNHSIYSEFLMLCERENTNKAFNEKLLLTCSSKFLDFFQKTWKTHQFLILRWELNFNSFVQKNDEFLLEALNCVNYLQGNKISRAIFFTPLIHHRHTMLVDAACAFLEIPRIYLYPNQVDGFLLPLIINSGGIENRSFVSLSNPRTNVSLDKFIERCQKSLKPQSYERDNLEINFYQSISFALIFCIYRHCKSLMTKSPMMKYYNRLGLLSDVYLLAQQRKFATKFKRLQKEEIEEIDVWSSLVIAAHTQPEASTVPEGGSIRTHYEVVVALREKGFKGQIYYKEHPASLRFFDKYVGPTRSGQYRYPQYIDFLINSGVKFLSAKSKLYFDREAISPVVVTMTGTIALERALLGLRTIVTGHPWFRECPGIVQLRELDFYDSGIVPEDWFRADPKIAAQAKVFVERILLECSFPNPEGIGNLHPYEDSDANASFLSAIEDLLMADNK